MTHGRLCDVGRRRVADRLRIPGRDLQTAVAGRTADVHVHRVLAALFAVADVRGLLDAGPCRVTDCAGVPGLDDALDRSDARRSGAARAHEVVAAVRVRDADVHD